MKIYKIFSVFIIFISFFMISQLTAKADFGPKPSTSIEITGMEGISYKVTLIAQHATGPYRNEFFGDYHPIMDYEDEEGYKFVGKYWSEEGDTTIEWGYYPPSPFKILIMTEHNTIYVSDKLENYAFNSYYKVNLSKQLDEGSTEVIKIKSVEKDYEYGKEVMSFILRVIITIIIELSIALLFMFRSKRELSLLLLVNVITQIGLNLVLNITAYFSGNWVAFVFFVLAEIGVFMTEILAYLILFKYKKTWVIFLYTLIANLLSFCIGILLYAFL